MNASFEPSGDQDGERLDFFAFVSWRVAPLAASASQISVSYALSSQFVSRTVYATHRPSGEIFGEPARFSERIWSTVGALFGRATGARCAPSEPVAPTSTHANIISFFITAPTQPVLASASPRRRFIELRRARPKAGRPM